MKLDHIPIGSQHFACADGAQVMNESVVNTSSTTLKPACAPPHLEGDRFVSEPRNFHLYEHPQLTLITRESVVPC